MALIHAPVYNKNRELVATSVTNLDIHDIARASATYGVERYFIIHPAPAQQDIVRRVMSFWLEGAGAEYNPHRFEALARVRLADTVEQALSDIHILEKGRRVYTVATAARAEGNAALTSYADLRSRLNSETGAYLLLFGTGWGLPRQTAEEADFILPPLLGPGPYNHLSVRSAASVILDRLRGR
ncbi:MAG: RNA methyltransferase [Gracilibacteraceae bacterium]|nr:RNA methyltransferase [Gracilibacteraceae bacterium]